LNKAAQTLRAQAQTLDKILVDDRIFPTYYRVALFGKGFPEHLQDQEFVYRSGHEGNLESVMEFTNRIKSYFPNAKVVNSTDLPPSEVQVDNFKGQFIQITTLQCSSIAEMTMDTLSEESLFS
jgi:hypothetical protein